MKGNDMPTKKTEPKTRPLAEIKAQVPTLDAKPEAEDGTPFRVHYRTSVDADRHTFDCTAADIGAAHTACRAHVADKHGEETRVFIDKVKVRGGA